MIVYNTKDFNMEAIKSAMEDFTTSQRADVNLYVYGVSDKKDHPKHSIYLTNYKHMEQMSQNLKKKGITIHSEGMGTYQKTDRITIGLSKSIRENVSLCAKIVWVIHATA